MCFLLNILNLRWKARGVPVWLFTLLAVGRWQWHRAAHPLQLLLCKRSFSTAATCKHTGAQAGPSRPWGHGGISRWHLAGAPGSVAGVGKQEPARTTAARAPAQPGPGTRSSEQPVREGLCRCFHRRPSALLSRGNLSTPVAVYSVVKWMWVFSTSLIAFSM